MMETLLGDLNGLLAESSSTSILFNDSQLTQPGSWEDKEHVKVYLRIRPLTAAEALNGESQDCVSAEPPHTVLLRPPGAPGADASDEASVCAAQRFRFSQVYGPDATQRELFQGTVKGLVKDVLRGGNSLVFTYGVTNAGKTFTFLGPHGDAGLLPRSLDLIFGSVGGKLSTGMSVKPQRCRELIMLSEEQRAEEAAFKNGLLPASKECDESDDGVGSAGDRMLPPGPAEDRVSLREEADTKFCIWVSFCEIYNENIHDLLERAPGGARRRTALRLAQDAQGNAFVKDLRWVQVDGADEAYRVLKLGKKNQSFSSTGINQLSSRSHSIFSIRIVRITAAQAFSVSELCLCDLAGSERCAKTGNRGERLKEAGNINTSLLVLGKCIAALRHNGHASSARLPRGQPSQHVPFRESKLTRYLQAFFCGRGKVCMMVNVNPCASAHDETLQVLKFSALAQKVVLLPSRAPPAQPHEPHSYKEGTETTARGSSIGWESSLEAMQEEDEEISMEDTMYQSEEDDDNDDKLIISELTHQQVALVRRLQTALKRARADNVLAETRVREDVCREFGRVFDDMQNDFQERLARETQILEERAEKRMEIFKMMTANMAACGEGRGTRSKVEEAQEEAARLDLRADESSAEKPPEQERKMQEEMDGLRHEVDRLTAALEASQQRVASETLRAEQASTRLQAAQEQICRTWAQITDLGRDFTSALGEGQNVASANWTSELQPLREDPTRRRLSSEQPGETFGPDRALRELIRELREKLREKLRQQREAVGRQLEEVGREQEASCRRLVQKLSEQELTTERLKAQLQEAGAAEEELNRVAAELRAEVASLKTKEEMRKDEAVQTDEAQVPMPPPQLQTEEPEAAQPERRLREQVAALQKKLQEREQAGDDRALQECRRMEAERRRELLAVAHEAVEHKDAELEKRALQVAKLQELAKQDSDKIKSLGEDLERKEEDSCDLREKLADYKKQIQQVHKDISTMKEEDRLLRQKLSEGEKVKKQLQSDLASRDRTIQQLKERPADKKGAETLRLYQEARQELEAKRRMADDMRSALLEQEETQQQMERALDEKVHLVQELSRELDKAKEMLWPQKNASGSADLQQAKEELASTRQSLKPLEEKYLTERHKWQEEKMALIGQIKEAEDKRNQEMKKFAEDRERRMARLARLEAELHEREQKMESWRQERDALVTALEVQLHKLLASQAHKDETIRRLRQDRSQTPPGADGRATETESRPAPLGEDVEDAGGRPDRADAQTSSVLESSEISTEDGRASRFPRPEMEISFSPLRPDRMALRRRGDSGAVTVVITRSARKRKSADSGKQDDVESENRKNTKATPTLSERHELRRPPASAGTRGRKDATLQKIGEFLQSSPTRIGSKAKKVMGLVTVSASPPSVQRKKSKRKLFSADISSPMDAPLHPVVSNNVVSQDKQDHHLIIKRRLRSRAGK